ncbi:hypothetical protein WN943_006631 [Citrus x changshan-huyou]
MDGSVQEKVQESPLTQHIDTVKAKGLKKKESSRGRRRFKSSLEPCFYVPLWLVQVVVEQLICILNVHVCNLMKRRRVVLRWLERRMKIMGELKLILVIALWDVS